MKRETFLEKVNLSTKFDLRLIKKQLFFGAISKLLEKNFLLSPSKKC